MTLLDAFIVYPWLKDILKELSSDVLNRVIYRKYAQNEIIINECLENTTVFIILSGVTGTEQTTETGSQLVTRKAASGDVIGLSGALSGEPEFSSRIFAKTTVEAVLIPLDLARDSFGKYPHLAAEMTRRVINRLHGLIDLISHCNNYPSYYALIYFLIVEYRIYSRSFPPEFGDPVEIIERRADIASFLGVNYRSLQRCITKLKHQGLLTVRSKKLYIDRKQYNNLRITLEEYAEQ